MAGPLDPVLYTTISNYKYGAENDVITNNPFLAAWKQKTNLKEKQGGTNITWPIEAARYVAFGSAPGDDMSARFVPSVRHQLPTLNWADNRVATSIDFGALRRNYGDQALVKLSDTEAKALWRDALTNGSTSLNGLILNSNISTSTNPLPFAGLPSFLLAPGATGLQGYNRATNTVSGGAPADTDQEVVPTSTSQTYAGLNLYRSGITAVDNPVADAWTPNLVNTSFTGWTGTNDDEANAVPFYTQYAVQLASRFDGSRQDYLPDFGVMDYNSFYNLGARLTKINAGFTVFANVGQEASNKFGTGFKCNNMLYHAGLLWFWDAAMPTETTYVINASQSGLMCQPTFNTMGDDELPIDTSAGGIENVELIEMHFSYNPLNQSIMIAGNMNNQATFSPRFQVRCSNYS
jgi:hypothetical protein